MLLIQGTIQGFQADKELGNKKVARIQIISQGDQFATTYWVTDWTNKDWKPAVGKTLLIPVWVKANLNEKNNKIYLNYNVQDDLKIADLKEPQK